MTDSAAARIAEELRAVMKAQSLTGADLADRIERLTGVRPSPTWISRRLGGARMKGLLDVDPDLFVFAQALEIDRDQLMAAVLHAVFGNPDTCGYVLTEQGKRTTTIPNAPEENR